MTEERSTPRYIKYGVGIVAMGLLAIGFSTWRVNSLSDTEDRRFCERAVAVREDGRAVWLFLVARESTRRDDPDVVEFVAFLNERLPRLECRDNVPMPIDQEA